MHARVLVAGVGNELLGDDGFGIAAAGAYRAAGPPNGVRVVEAGIAGVGLVQDLMDRYDGVIVVDAVDRGAGPGSIHVLRLEVPAIAEFSDEQRRELLADMHFTVPSRAMILAAALDVLPPHAYLVGCQPAQQELEAGLSPAVEAAIPRAVEEIGRLVDAIRQPAPVARGA